MQRAVRADRRLRNASVTASADSNTGATWPPDTQTRQPLPGQPGCPEDSGAVDVPADVQVEMRGRQSGGLHPPPAMHVSGGDQLLGLSWRSELLVVALDESLVSVCEG